MKNTPSWIQNIYPIPAEDRQWPTASELLYALAFVTVFFVMIPWLMGA